MRSFITPLNRSITKRPNIKEGEVARVYFDFNTDLQVWELALVFDENT